MKNLQVILSILLISITVQQYLGILGPEQLITTFSNSKLKVTSSPIGLKPKKGSLVGKIMLAQPLNACSEIKQLEDYQGEDEIFLLADDLGCLQSVKAHNLASSGTYIGLIKRNINNTLHDREIDIVHIPILQLDPIDYQKIVSYIIKKPEQSVTVMADFNPQQQRKKINIELWLSPTQNKAYIYASELRQFILNQPNQIQFYPRFVIHSQTNRKQYVGCYSSGRFCPPQLEFEGKPQGTAIVAQSLRQIIIASRSVKDWFIYAYFYFFNCLKVNEDSQQFWQSRTSQLCSQNAMLTADINYQQIHQQQKKSFQGPRPQIDGNIYLQEQRQMYISQRITKFPILLINGNEYPLQNQNPDELKIRICNMIHPDPNQQTVQCQKLTNPPLFTTGDILIIVGIFITLLVGIMVACKRFMYRKMKGEMKGQVDKTLSQYYRYMETLEQPDPHATGKVPLVENKIETNQLGSVQLQAYKQNK